MPGRGSNKKLQDNTALSLTSKRNKPALSSSQLNQLADATDICPECQNPVKDDQQGILCEKCEQWWHADCVSISTNAYGLLMKNENINVTLRIAKNLLIPLMSAMNIERIIMQEKK